MYAHALDHRPADTRVYGLGMTIRFEPLVLCRYTPHRASYSSQFSHQRDMERSGCRHWQRITTVLVKDYLRFEMPSKGAATVMTSHSLITGDTYDVDGQLRR